MPGDPKECRLHALECMRIARAATKPDARDSFTELAKTWLRLAYDLEVSHDLLETWGGRATPPGARSRQPRRSRD
jgi:hypothetical protein